MWATSVRPSLASLRSQEWYLSVTMWDKHVLQCLANTEMISISVGFPPSNWSRFTRNITFPAFTSPVAGGRSLTLTHLWAALTVLLQMTTERKPVHFSLTHPLSRTGPLWMYTFASLTPDLCQRKYIFSLDKTRTGVTHVMIYTNVEIVY